jgi:hypothetical protein
VWLLYVSNTHASFLQDNPVNMMLLATYMKKNKWDFEKAENGLLALQAFQKRPEGFDVIFMGRHSLLRSVNFSLHPSRCLDAHNDRLRIHTAHP